MKKGTSGNAPYEEDLLLYLGVESISDVTFFSRLETGDAMFHSRTYKRVSRRNNFTVAYQRGATIFYGQVEVFFAVKDNLRLACGAIIAPMPLTGHRICNSDELLGASPVNHIVCLQQPAQNRFDVIPLEDIIDVCVYMKFSDTDVGYAAHFPNHIEKD